MGIKISDLPSADPLSSTDIFPASQGSDTNGVTWANILTAFETAAAGTVVDSGDYTALPASASTITFTDTTGLEVGTPLRIIQTTQAVQKLYIITAITVDTLVTVNGPPLLLGDPISEIAILSNSRVVQLDLFVPGGYDLLDDTSTLLQRNTRSIMRWQLPKAKCVRASFAHNTPGSGTQPNVNVSIAGNAVFTDNTNAGALLSGSANAWSTPIGAGTASLSNYNVNFNDAIELILNAGANLDARDLSASIVFILE